MTFRPVSLTPYLTVRSFAAAQAFYCDKLGFVQASTGGMPPSLGTVKKDGLHLGLTEPNMQVSAKTIGAGRVQIAITDLTVYHSTLKTAGVKTQNETTMTPDRANGMLDLEKEQLISFSVLDPDGNEIEFCEADVASAETTP